MATTTNYGWTTPDDTALVKDGAAAIRTLGTSVDTTTKNLNPETTLGDIVYRSSTANVKTRLGIGSTGQVLTVASGVPSWATPSSGASFIGCDLRNATAPTISDGADTIITFGAENYDTDGFHSTSTNTGRITIPSGKAGKYLFTAAFRWTANATGRRIVYLKKNGTSVVGAFECSVNSTTYPSLQVNEVCEASVGDYFELLAYQTSGGNLAFLDSDFFFQATYLGA